MAMSRKAVTVVSASERHEADIWGYSKPIPAAYAADLMYDRLPDLKEITIPRDVFERTDLSPSAKLIYGLFAHYRAWKYWRFSEISGLIGESTQHTARYLQELEDAGLLKCEKEELYAGKGRARLPHKYYCPVLHSRMDTPTIPKFLTNDISNIEEELKERFHGLESE